MGVKRKTKHRQVAISNLKGGVGKTATAVNVASSLAKMGSNVLLVDCDHGNASNYVRSKQEAMIGRKTLFDMVELKKTPEECIIKTPFENLSVIAADAKLLKWDKKGHKYNVLKNYLRSSYVVNTFDWVIYDVRPQPGSLFEGIMSCVDWYLVPLFAESDGVDGIKELFDELREVQEAYNPELKSAGLLITRFDKAISTHNIFKTLIEELTTEFNLPFLGTIPLAGSLSGSVNIQTPLPFYKTSAKLPVRDAYMNLAKTLDQKLTFKSGRIPKVPLMDEGAAIEAIRQIDEFEYVLE